MVKIEHQRDHFASKYLRKKMAEEEYYKTKYA